MLPKYLKQKIFCKKCNSKLNFSGESEYNEEFVFYCKVCKKFFNFSRKNIKNNK